MNQFHYIFAGATHHDASRHYMEQLGMNSEQIESVRSQYQYEVGQVHELRRAAYAAESDQLYMEWQYDQTPEAEQAWRDQVAAIKARYPLYPELD